MKESLRAFMSGIIDYAGLFPPADLSLDAAFDRYVKHRQEEDAWMLSRFIIPAGRLDELAPHADTFKVNGKPSDFSVLGGATGTAVAFQHELEQVIEACEGFVSAHAGGVTTDMLEVKLPQEAALSHDVSMLTELMDRAADTLDDSALTPSVVCYEGLFDGGWKKDMEAVLKAIARHNEGAGAREHYRYAAFKLRCGGVKPEHFPTPEQVAFVLTGARRHNVALKGTAGLHHPVRHYAESVQTKMHGFFNVFGGAMLAYANDLDAEELHAIVTEEDSGQFVFSDEALQWRDYSVSTSEIESLREVALLSYGSCSFDEPRQDLRDLKLL